MFMLQELQECLSFYCASLYWLHRWCDFTDWKFKQVYHHHFFQQQWFISCLSHFDNSQNISSFFLIIVFVFVICDQFSSVAQSCPTLCNPKDWIQHARPPCPSPTLGACSYSCPLTQWCHPTISSSVVPFSSCPESFPASASFQMSQFFASGGQSIGASTSASVLPMNTKDWCPLGWTGWISLQSKGLSRVFSNTTKSINPLALSFLYGPTLTSIYDYWKNHSFD